MITKLLDRVDGLRETGEGRWIARCPAHNDKGPSLSVRLTDDRVLIHCFAGCEPLDIVSAVGLTLADLFEQPRAHRGTSRLSRIPAADALACIDHEVRVVSLIAGDSIAPWVWTSRRGIDYSRPSSASAPRGLVALPRE